MPKTPAVPAEPGLDYDPQVRDQIAALLAQLRVAEDPAAKERLCDELDRLIFHREAPPERDSEPTEVEKIERLLEEARQNPARKQAVYDELDVLIFGLKNARD